MKSNDEPITQTYEEHKEQLNEKQSNLSYEQIKSRMASRSEGMTELDNLPKQEHRWTDRGAKLTCENAGHAYHEAWKPQKVVL